MRQGIPGLLIDSNIERCSLISLLLIKTGGGLHFSCPVPTNKPLSLNFTQILPFHATPHNRFYLHNSHNMASSSSLPANVHVSSHPCLRAKLSQLRSRHANARETKVLVHEIALIVGCEALAKSLQTTASGTVSSDSLTAAP